MFTPIVEGAFDLDRRMAPAPRNGGLHLADHWVWCGSVIRATNLGEDGRWHMFASVWPKSLPWNPNWLFASRVVRASSDRPEGPYRLEQEVLPRRGREYFDGLCTHNPAIRKCGDTYLLFYLGVTYPDAVPQPGDPPCPPERFHRVWRNKRIGLATSKSILGPWTRRDEPLFAPRPDHFDALANTNPAPVVHEDGSVVMLYKSRTVDDGPQKIGLARAAHYSGEFRPVSDEPVFQFADPRQHTEDPFLWYDRQRKLYRVLMKDWEGGIVGVQGAGLYATSPDARHWSVQRSPAYTRRICWEDGTVTQPLHLERAHVLLDDEDEPTHLFFATAPDIGRGFWNFDDCWNVCLPLR